MITHPHSQRLIHSLTRDELLAFCKSIGAPAFRTEQLWRWLYVQKVFEWTAMKNIPSALLDKLAESFVLTSAVKTGVEESRDSTKKILAELPDGERVEEVLISVGNRKTVCVSSQAGCKFHCAFCASGQAGFRRDLNAGEIVGQVLLAEQEFGCSLTNVVFMGIGEPFDNYDAVLAAIRIINDSNGLNIGARRITISTCGLIPGIERLQEEGIQVELAVSLHAPTDELRSSLMPINKKYNLDMLINACDVYSNKTNRIITFEYILINGVNDSFLHAQQLVRLLSPLKCRVNLLPLSSVEEYSGTKSAEDASDIFIQTLSRAGINTTLRYSKGTESSAACGQLRYRGGTKDGAEKK